MVGTCKRCGEKSPGYWMYNHRRKMMDSACKHCVDKKFFIIMQLAEIDFENIEQEVNGR